MILALIALFLITVTLYLRNQISPTGNWHLHTVGA